MLQEVKTLFLLIKDDGDLNYKTPIDKARLFIKIVEALVKIEVLPELKEDWKDLIKLKEELNYDYNEYKSNYNPNTYINRINIKVKRNALLINKIIQLYYKYVKDSDDLDDDLFEM